MARSHKQSKSNQATNDVRTVGLDKPIIDTARLPTTVLKSHTKSAAYGLTPVRLGGILRDAVSGDATQYLTLAEEMEERDLHYQSVLATRKLAVQGMPIQVIESDDTDPQAIKHADAVRGLIESQAMSGMIFDLLDGLSKGYSVVEILWHAHDGMWRPADYCYHDPRYFVFDELTQTQLLIRGETRDQDRPIVPGHFLIHRPQLKSGISIRGGLARLVAFSFCCKSFSVRDWLAFLEVYGMPIRVGRYPNNADDAAIDALQSAVINLGTDAAAVLPDSLQIDFQSVSGAHNGDNFRAYAEWADKQVSKAVLGQTMTTDDGSSMAQAKVHAEVRDDIATADARQLSATINRDLVRPFVDLNFGPQSRYPQIVIAQAQQEDLALLSNALTPLINAGLRVSASEIRERFGLREPEPDEEMLGGSVVPTQPDHETEIVNNERQQHALDDASDELDQLVDDARPKWTRIMSSVTGPIVELAQQATSQAEFVAQVEARAQTSDTTQLIRELSIGAYKARALGDGEQ